MNRKSYEHVKNCYNCKKKLNINMLKIKNIVKLEIIVIKQVNIEMLYINLKYDVSKEIPIVFHNGSNYYYYYFS